MKSEGKKKKKTKISKFTSHKYTYNIQPPGQHESLVVDGEQQCGVVFGTLEPRSHVARYPFSVRFGRPAHRIELFHRNDPVQRLVACGQSPKLQIVFAIRVQKPNAIRVNTKTLLELMSDTSETVKSTSVLSLFSYGRKTLRWYIFVYI